MSDDIGRILENWPYEPDQDIIVRIINGEDGLPKLQMRIDMGIVQLEMDGHPAGGTVEGFPTWLDYYEDRQKHYDNDTVDDFFTLSAEDCVHLRREGIQYYYRYLGLMKLCDYERVVRDTERNLRLFAFVKKYAAGETDRWALDQYRAYVIMMFTRASTALILEREPETGIVKALDVCSDGIGRIAEFYHEYSITGEMDNSIELTLLNALKSKFLKGPAELTDTPTSPLITPLSLDEQLRSAVDEERFEDAARIRDMMNDQKDIR